MKDYSRDTAFIRRFRAAAVEIALRKMDEVRVNLEKAGKPLVEFGPRLSSGGHFAQFFLWDTVFCAMWARHAADFPGIPLTEPLDNLYRLADDEGFINKEFTPRGVPMWNPSHPVAFAPPILSWIEEVLQGKAKPARQGGNVFMARSHGTTLPAGPVTDARMGYTSEMAGGAGWMT